MSVTPNLSNLHNLLGLTAFGGLAEQCLMANLDDFD